MQDMNQTCLKCGHSFGLHSTDGARCPKNGGFPINGKLEWFATHFEGGLSESDQLRARIAELETHVENANIAATSLQIQNVQLIRENARLTTAHEMQGEELVTLPKHMVIGLEDKLKAQAEKIRAIKEAIEDIKYYVGNPSAWEHYDDGVSEKIRAILKAAGMA